MLGVRGVVSLSKIFKISGNFTRNGKCTTPDSAWVGEIVMANSIFSGYCEDSHGRTRYITGVVNWDGDKISGLTFYQLSNNPNRVPFMYTITNGNGRWKRLTERRKSLYFEDCGVARTVIEEQPYSTEKRNHVLSRFIEVDASISWNNLLLKNVCTAQNDTKNLGILKRPV